MFRALLPLFLACSCARAPQAAAPSETDRIEQLLAAIAASDVTFIRNGREHGATEAAAHLRRKWGNAGGRIETAEQFIEHLATRSSFSGRAYQIRLGNGETLESAAWMRAKLADIDARPR